MVTKLQELKWQLHNYKQKQLLIWGLKNRMIFPYDNELIEKLRNIYYGGIPASILLLSDGMSNGHCYDRALLMSRAFLDSEDDVNLLYASIDSLKLNPQYIKDDPLYADHCIFERITKDGKHLIYDTSAGFIYDKKIYWLIENPKVRKINTKESIKKFVEEDEKLWPEDLERDSFSAAFVLQMIEMTYGRPNEMYSLETIELLQREVEHFKKIINFDEVVHQTEEDMRKLRLLK